MTALSVVIPIWNQRELVRACLASLRDALEGMREWEVIVVDDGSTDGAAEVIAEELDEARLLRNETNRGFAYAANRGMREAKGEYLLLLNSDTEITRAGLAKLLRYVVEHPAYAGAVPRLVDRDGTTQRACLSFPRFSTPLFFATPLQRWWPRSPELKRYLATGLNYFTSFDVEQPPASCWMLRRSAWGTVGEFDESLELFFNDVDWCRRLAAGRGKLRFLTDCTVLHHGGASTGERSDFVERWQTDRLRYFAKHHGLLGRWFTKLCVSWAFADWWLGVVVQRARGRGGEPVGPISRAFLGFLRA